MNWYWLVKNTWEIVLYWMKNWLKSTYSIVCSSRIDNERGGGSPAHPHENKQFVSSRLMTRRTSFCVLIDRWGGRTVLAAKKKSWNSRESNENKTRRSKTTITIKCNQYIKFKFELKRNYINKQQLDVHNN